MKNRLEVAKELLTDDGFIAIAIDHCELFYLGILADEIFGRENRVGLVSILINPMGRQHANFFSATNDYMLVYAKNQNEALFNNIVIDEEKKDKFNLKDNIGKYKLNPFLHDHKKGSMESKENNFYPIFVNPNTLDLSINEKEGFIKLLPITKNGIKRSWQNIKKTTIQKIKKGEVLAKKQNNGIELFYKFREQQRYFTTWNSKKYNANHHGVRLLEKITGKKSVSFPKSLYTVLDTLKITTGKDDIILDFHAGSGTTGHAVLALNKEDGGNRKFILVEQLDKHIEVCKERIQKVLQQENINDNFIYCELAKWNEKAKEHILARENLEQLKLFFNEMIENYFLNYNLKIKEFQEQVINEEAFKNLSLEKQKQMFCTMLDNNQMYVCRSEMDDAKFGISEEDREMTRAFYKNNI